MGAMLFWKPGVRHTCRTASQLAILYNDFAPAVQDFWQKSDFQEVNA